MGGGGRAAGRQTYNQLTEMSTEQGARSDKVARGVLDHQRPPPTLGYCPTTMNSALRLIDNDLDHVARGQQALCRHPARFEPAHRGSYAMNMAQ